MAKVGEGDSRWIVSDRKDGTNCNAWHWEEKDITGEVKDKIKSVFSGLSVVDDDNMKLKIKEASEVTGEVSVAQRKGRIFCYFEINVTLKYGGSVAGSEDACNGKAVLPDVDHDNFKEDFEIRVNSTETNASASKAEAFMRNDGRKIIRKAVASVFDEMFETYNVGKNLKNLQAQAGGASPAAASSASASGSPSAPAKPASPAPAPKPVTSSAPASKIDWKIQWRCPIEDLWTVLTDQQRACAYTRAPAKIDPRSGGVFEYLGGTISGYYQEVEHPKKITMQWRLSSWKSGLFSTVVMILEPEERGVTNLQFAQIGIPDGEVDRVKQGWNVNFWEPIKMMFGFPMEFK